MPVALSDLVTRRRRVHFARVLLFKRILDFKQATLARLRDKRKGVRHPVGPGFPLKGTLSLRGLESVSCDWSGSVTNLSARGASLILPPAAVAVRGEKTILRLKIEQHVLQVPCIVAHFRVLSTHAVCGLTLEFTDFTAQKAYSQLLEAVRLGASFAPVPVSALARSPAGLGLEQYRADPKSRLSIWRKTADRQIERFELVLGDHCLRGTADGPTLEVEPAAGRPDPAANLAAEVIAEVRQLYRWLLPNLSKAVPADVRHFLQQAINENRTPAERKIARTYPTKAPFPPPRRAATRPPLAGQ